MTSRVGGNLALAVLGLGELRAEGARVAARAGRAYTSATSAACPYDDRDRAEDVEARITVDASIDRDVLTMVVAVVSDPQPEVS